MTRTPLLAGVVMAGLAGPAAAQDQALVDALREAFRSEAARSDLGNAFQSLTVFGATPGISAATFHVDDGSGADLDLNAIKLSPSRSFHVGLGVRPYVEGTFGYLSAEQTIRVLEGVEDATTAAVDIDAFTVLAGIGIEIPVARGTVIRPIGLIGYSRIEDSAKIRGAFAEELALAGGGIVFDVEIDSLLYGAALELEHARSFEGGITFNGTVRYNQLFDEVLDASDPVLESSGSFGVFTAGAEIDGPTGMTVFSRELRWIGFAANTYLPGEQNDALGFSFFFEIGAGIELVDREVISGIEGISLRGSGIIGDNVTGWTAGLSVEF